jgi:hypothetical protein
VPRLLEIAIGRKRLDGVFPRRIVVAEVGHDDGRLDRARPPEILHARVAQEPADVDGAVGAPVARHFLVLRQELRLLQFGVRATGIEWNELQRRFDRGDLTHHVAQERGFLRADVQDEHEVGLLKLAPKVGDTGQLARVPEGDIEPELTSRRVERRLGAIPHADEPDARARLTLLRARTGDAEEHRQEENERATAAAHRRQKRTRMPATAPVLGA